MAYVIGTLVFEASHSDGNWAGAERTYVINQAFLPDNKETFDPATARWTPSVPGPLVGVIRNNFPGLEAALQLIFTGANGHVGDHNFSADLLLANGPFEKLFDLSVKAGSLQEALSVPRGLVLTEPMAHKLFGEGVALGKTVSLMTEGKLHDYRVRAVVKVPPASSHLQFDMVSAYVAGDFEQDGKNRMESWNWSGNSSVYLLLKKNTDARVFTNSFSERLHSFVPSKVGDTAFSLQPLVGMQLWTRAEHGLMREPLAREAVLGLALTALMVLMTAIANHISLRASMALRRVREMAVRRVLGASRIRLAVRLFMEELILMAVAVFCATDMVPFLGGKVGNFVGADMPFLVSGHVAEMATLILAALLVAGLSAVFPLVRLTGSRTVGLLRDAQSTVTSQSGRLRFLMIVTQVALGMGLALASLGVYANIHHLIHMDKGFETADKLHIRAPMGQAWLTGREGFERELASVDGVDRVVASSNIPFISQNSRMGMDHPRTHKYIEFEQMNVEPGFFEAFRLLPLYGRVLDTAHGMDAAPAANPDGKSLNQNIVASVAATKVMGFDKAEEALGFQLWSAMWGEDGKVTPLTLSVVGVVPDINFKSGRKQSVPTLYFSDPQAMNFLTLDIGNVDRKALLAQLQTKWLARFPNLTFRYSFASDNLNKAYGQEEELAGLLLICAALAGVVMMSGLAALARHEVITRRREVALRRVLGAGSRHIATLMFRRFGRPVVVGLAISVPVVWYFLRGWFAGYQHHVTLTLVDMILFALAALAFCLALLTGETIRAARLRPAKVLHHE